MASIPGFGGESMVTTSDGSGEKAFTEVNIPGGSEWRFEVPFKTILKFKVTNGLGEIFGTELPSNIEILLTGVKYSIYAPLPEGCKVQYYCLPNKHNFGSSSEDGEIMEYISEETCMNQYLNLHLGLECIRQEVSDHNILNNEPKTGPRVLIIGNRHSGKTVLSKILASYAFKMDRSPVLINLNPRDGVFSLPGSLTASPISDRLDIESVNGYGGSTTSGTTLHNPKQPLVKNFGFTDINENLELYKYQVSKLGVAVMSRIEEDNDVRNSGLIIDTPPLTSKDTAVIENIVSDFEVNIIVVVGNERLLIDLKKKMKHKLNSSQLEIVKVPKSGGVVEVDESYIRKVQEESIKEYFNGSLKSPLSPFKTEVDINDCVIYKGVLSLDLDNNFSFLPSGDSYTPGEAESNESSNEDKSLDEYYASFTEVNSSNLENSIVAITQLPQNNKLKKDLLNTCVLGYAHVSKVDDVKGKIKILLPFPSAIPRNALIATNIRYVE